MTVKNRRRHTGNSSLKLSISKPKLSIHWNLHWFSNWQTCICSSIYMRTYRIFFLEEVFLQRRYTEYLAGILSLNKIARSYQEKARVLSPSVTSTELTTSWLQGTIFTRILSYLLVPITFSLHSTRLNKNIIATHNLPCDHNCYSVCSRKMGRLAHLVLLGYRS